MKFESEAADGEQASLIHREQGLGRRRCLNAIAFCVEMESGTVVQSWR